MLAVRAYALGVASDNRDLLVGPSVHVSLRFGLSRHFALGLRIFDLGLFWPASPSLFLLTLSDESGKKVVCVHGSLLWELPGRSK
jgi:hypothetical protein